MANIILNVGADVDIIGDIAMTMEAAEEEIETFHYDKFLHEDII